MATYPRANAYRQLASSNDPLIRQVAVLMDEAVRIGPVKVGLDGILGLIPGIGDGLSALVSAFIVIRAAQEGVGRGTLARMVANVAIDSTLGAIPIVGDLFDFMYKSNTKNLRLYEQAMSGARDERRDWGFVALVIVATVLLLSIPVALGVWALMKLLG